LGVSPQKGKKNVLVPPEVHLVDHVSPKGRRGGPLTFLQIWERTNYVTPKKSTTSGLGASPPKRKFFDPFLTKFRQKVDLEAP